MLLPEPEDAGIECDKLEFRAMLLAMLRAAKHYVLLQSPFLRLQLLKSFVHEIEQCIRRGVVVCLFVQEPEDWHVPRDLLSPVRRAEHEELQSLIDMLVAIGVHVNLRPDIHKKIAVFDGLILFYGTLNFFSYGKSTDSIRRFDSPALALNTIQKENLFCDACYPDDARRRERVTVVSPECSVGKLICDLRERLGLGQRDMASRAKTTRSRLDSIEKEKVFVPVQIFAALCNAAGLDVLVVPRYAVATVKRVLEMIPEPRK